MDVRKVAATPNAPFFEEWIDSFYAREIDFVVERGPGVVDAIVVKITPDAFNASNLNVFRSLYPNGDNCLICLYVRDAYSIRRGEHPVIVCGIEHLN